LNCTISSLDYTSESGTVTLLAGLYDKLLSVDPMVVVHGHGTVLAAASATCIQVIAN